MDTIQNNDFLILNSIIYKINTNTDFLSMRTELLEQLTTLLDFDCADFYLSEGGGSSSLVSRVSYHFDCDAPQKYETMDYSQGILGSGKSMVYRESDIISDERRVQTPYYQKVYAANNLHHALQMILAYNATFLGVITLYKRNGKDDFKYSDIFLMDMLKEHLAYRIHQEGQKAISTPKITIAQASNAYALTKREVEILPLLLQGFTNDQICQNLRITNNTLKKHILNLYRKLGINNRIQLLQMID